MRRQKIGCCALAVVCLFVCVRPSFAAQQLTVRALVPTFTGPAGLSANVSAILALRLWTTLRPRANPNPEGLYFGFGQIEWSRRVTEDSPEAATLAARETKSDVALWGAVEEYGSHVIVTVKLVIPPKPTINAERRKWTVVEGNLKLELDLPSISYQFSPLIISNDVVAKYSAPDQFVSARKKSRNATVRD